MARNKEISIELARYCQRVEFIVRHVCGEEYFALREQIWADTNVSQAIYRRALDLYKQGCSRASEHPEQFEDLVTWQQEKTLTSYGRPSVQEALQEEYIDTWMGDEWRADPDLNPTVAPGES